MPFSSRGIRIAIQRQQHGLAISQIVDREQLHRAPVYSELVFEVVRIDADRARQTQLYEWREQRSAVDLEQHLLGAPVDLRGRMDVAKAERQEILEHQIVQQQLDGDDPTHGEQSHQ